MPRKVLMDLIENAPEDRISFLIESYGVRVQISSNSSELLAKLEFESRRALAHRITVFENFELGFSGPRFSVDRDGSAYKFYQDGEFVTAGDSEILVLKFFNSMLRVVVGEMTDSYVFIHAGVVKLLGKIIVFPGHSYKGKSTLVAELLKEGAEYYSDEYAVLDSDGLVWPYPREISLRSRIGSAETDVTPRELGGVIGKSACPADLVIFTEYLADAVWRPDVLSVGAGILEVVNYTLPFNRNSSFCLEVLAKALKNAVIYKGFRGEADAFVKTLTLFCKL